MTTQKTNKQRPRTYARNRAKRSSLAFETDSVYFLKLVGVILVSTLWLKFSAPISWMGIPLTALPLGMLVGLLAIKYYEKHQSDRKIWYAVIVVTGIMTYFLPAGIVI